LYNARNLCTPRAAPHTAKTLRGPLSTFCQHSSGFASHPKMK
jgi:hypothetical protein